MGMIVSSGRFGGATWQTALGPIALDTDNDGWSGYTLLNVIDNAQFLVSGGTQIRVTFEAAAAQGLTIQDVYIGHAAAAGDAYDFEGTPTQLLFSGSGGVAISAGAQAVSDAAAFVLDPAKDLIVAFYVNGAASADDIRIKNSVTGVDFYYKNASDAATVNKTGYSTVAGRAVLAKVEILV